MSNEHIPGSEELPSTATLLKSTAVAAAVATFLLVTAVLPAEYGIDPTGIGRAVGLQRMGEIKVSLAEEVAGGGMTEAELAAACDARESGEGAQVAVADGVSKDELKVTLAPNEGTEIKVTMAKGQKVEYVWYTDGGPANFDVHGDSRALKINYHSYGKGSEQKSEGVIEAAFDGSHGWFWRNRTKKTMTITLQTSGFYTDIKHLK